MSSPLELEDEIVALQAIFENELERLAPQHFRIRFESRPPAGLAEGLLACSLEVTFPVNYPNVSPHLAVTPVRGLLRPECDELEGILRERADVLIGGPAIYELIEVKGGERGGEGEGAGRGRGRGRQWAGKRGGKMGRETE